MNASVTLKSPDRCSGPELAAFESALHAAGETASPTLPERIRRAECLAFVRDPDGKLLGVGALKCPKAEHRAGLFKRASAQVSSEPFTLELGWLAGADDAMHPIVAALVVNAAERPVFVNTRTDETALHATLAQHDFRIAGAPFASSHGAHSNQIYIRGA